jgi:hypothetical protein
MAGFLGAAFGYSVIDLVSYLALPEADASQGENGRSGPIWRVKPLQPRGSRRLPAAVQE